MNRYFVCFALIILNGLFSTLTAIDPPFNSPSRRYIAHNNYNAIINRFKSYGTNPEHFKVFEKAMDNESYGFFGYHGARRDFRIFQDIIRIGIEEILEIPIRDDFHFFRIPGDPIQNIGSAKEFLSKYNYNIFDDTPIQGHQILSVNIALYGYHTNDSNCSVYYFVKDFNWAHHSYEKKLITFFILLGIDPSYIQGAFDIGRSSLNQSAVLIQLFDASHYKMVDTQTYLSHVSGRVHELKTPPSKVILDVARSNFPQLRLMMDNSQALNPFSSLLVKRYDLNLSETVSKYEQLLRDYFRTLPIDKSQKEIYKEHLLELWNNTQG